MSEKTSGMTSQPFASYIDPPALRAGERWVNKTPDSPPAKTKPKFFKDHIHKRNGEYWFGNKPVKHIINEARKQGLIVAPPDHSDQLPHKDTEN